LLNNRPWKVTRNLEEVLRHLRETPSEQRIWIDALSINQSDIPERNAQVSEMRKVYSSASLTILWLGTDQNPSISKLIEMASLCYVSENLSDGSWLKLVTIEGLVTLQRALCKLAPQEYWRRAWVVQEVMYSRNVWLTYGHKSLPYAYFARFWSEISSQITDRHQDFIGYLERTDGVPLFTSISLLIWVMNGGPSSLPEAGSGLAGASISLDEWMKTGISKKSTDPRDIVFAYHGCFPPEIGAMITIDYKCSLAEVLTAMTKIKIQTKSLDLILDSAYNSGDANLPSWVPEIPAQDAFPIRVSLWGSDRSKASGSLSAKYDFVGKDGLSVHGIRIGTVSRVTPPWDYENQLESQTVRPECEVFKETRRSLLEACEALDVTANFENPVLDEAIQAFFDLELTSSLPRQVKAWLFGRAVPLLQPSQLGFLDTTTWYNPRFIDGKLQENWTGSEWVQKAPAGASAGDGQSIVSRLSENAKKPPNELFTRFENIPMIQNRRRMFSYRLQKIDGTVSDDGFGLGCEKLEPGDTICIILGCSVPVVLRWKTDHYVFVADTMMPKFMAGEAVAGMTGEQEFENFLIK
jgi:hypothetical protein